MIGRLLILSLLTPFAALGATVELEVPGTANPWLAGVPSGVRDGAGDSVPANAPIPVPLELAAGRRLRFSATGSVSHLRTPPRGTPDGLWVTTHRAGNKNGIAFTSAPVNALLGVFLADNSTVDGRPPPALIFNSSRSINYVELAPRPGQVFFIGDGMTAEGHRQSIIVPPGVTTLYLGTMDSAGWFNNTGVMSVEVSMDP